MYFSLLLNNTGLLILCFFYLFSYITTMKYQLRCRTPKVDTQGLQPKKRKNLAKEKEPAIKKERKEGTTTTSTLDDVDEFAGITDDDIAALDIVIRSEFDDLDDKDMEQVIKYMDDNKL
jgi:hypothetical protein